MILLAIGDVVSISGCEFIMKKLPAFKRFKGVDLCIVNGENSAKGNGLTPQSAQMIFDAGADVITTGNHVWQRKEFYDYMDENPFVLRPYNYPKSCSGRGYVVLDKGRTQVLVANIQGNAFMDSFGNPFLAADEILQKVGDGIKVKIFDMHAEATSEKCAMAFYLDGRATVLFGTHTHVQTSDERIYPKGLGYITDLGMTGPQPSVLGLEPNGVITKFKTGTPQRFDVSENPVEMEGALFDMDIETGRTTYVERIALK